MRRLAILGTALILLAAAHRTWAQSNNQCDQPGETPDVIVGDIPDVASYTGIGGITAFSIGTTSCNVGSCWLNWIADMPEHPVIGQNMFRLKNGRFEQIGQSWLKHGFTALQGSVCGTCMAAPNGTHLGINCSDPYSSGLNAGQTRLGPKFEVNATTGVYPYPATNMSQTGNSIYKRLQVHDFDLDPTLNPGALYFVEGQYVTHDDATAGNGANNASYRRITVGSSGGNWTIAIGPGNTQRGFAAIQAWKANDAGVTEATVSVGGDGLYIIAAKATALGGGVYHYEYAVQNLTSDRAVKLFSVPLPNGASVTNVGFHDVDYHSGEPFDGTDWTATVQANSVSWTTQDFEANPNANALRWGTLYNFRFDANVPPGNNNKASFVFFKPGFPITTSFTTVTPLVCNNDGICQSSESCGTCPSDCNRQGGGTGCCGNGSCEIGESPCRCGGDCGAQAPTESSCGNGIDDDCDNTIDCSDVDCCASAVCAAGDHDGDHFTAVCDCNDSDASVYPGAPELCDGIANDCSGPGWPQTPAGEQDADGDGARRCSGDCDDTNAARFPGNAEVCDGLDNDCADGVPANELDADGDGRRLCSPDCDDANSAAWATPGEVIGVLVERDLSGTARIQWSPPAAPGGTVLGYDTVRSSSAADFMAASCLETNGSDTTTFDLTPGAPGLAAFYLVRARNACPSGIGPLGYDSNGQIRIGRTCP